MKIFPLVSSSTGFPCTYFSNENLFLTHIQKQATKHVWWLKCYNQIPSPRLFCNTLELYGFSMIGNSAKIVNCSAKKWQILPLTIALLHNVIKLHRCKHLILDLEIHFCHFCGWLAENWSYIREELIKFEILVTVQRNCRSTLGLYSLSI